MNGPVGVFMTPLQEACVKDNEDIVNLLIEHGADVDAITARFRQMTLELACNSRNNLGIAQLLLNAGADVNGGGGVVAPLHCAVAFENIEAIELLIEAGADVNRVSTDAAAGSSPLHWAASDNQLIFQQYSAGSWCRS